MFPLCLEPALIPIGLHRGRRSRRDKFTEIRGGRGRGWGGTGTYISSRRKVSFITKKDANLLC